MTKDDPTWISAYPKNGKTWYDMECPICKSKDTRVFASLGMYNLNGIQCYTCNFFEYFPG